MVAALSGQSRLVAGAGETSRVVRVGVIDPYSDPVEWQEFIDELRRLGWVNGRNLVFEGRGRGLTKSDLDKLAAELVSHRVELIFTGDGTNYALAAKRATNSIPIVFLSSSDPVGLGVVSSLSRPKGNITGSSSALSDSGPKSLQFLVEAIGRRRARIVEISPAGTRSQNWFGPLNGAMVAAAARLGFSYDVIEVSSVAEVAPLMRRLAEEEVGALRFTSWPMFLAHFREIAALCIDLRLPSLGDPRSGFLMDYLPDSTVFARQAGRMVNKILRGAKPSDLPVEEPSVFELTINLTTAEALRLQLPEALRLRAARLIR